MSPTLTRQLEFDLSASEFRALCGEFGKNFKTIAHRFNVKIHENQNCLAISGEPFDVERAQKALNLLASELKDGADLSAQTVHLIIQSQMGHASDEEIHIRTKKGTIRARGKHQSAYVRDILRSDVSFGVGPAGTGKTYLAVACAVEMIERGEIERILLVRPAVEAGEKLGFLPGDLTQKIDPYLRPLYDALYEMLGFERVGKMIERQIIEVAPLAYMRGRTLNHSFVILDEAQNTTREQMKMFLTRLGFGSRAVITGDLTQIDLPRHQTSGLKQALDILANIDGIAITYFDAKDVVRHHLVQKIVEAYDEFDKHCD